MAKVYTGKVAIPGDRIDDFLKLMKEAEERRAPFRQQLTELNEEFYENLLSKVSDRTASKHTRIIGVFIDFICGYTDVESIEEITRGMVNTHFKQGGNEKSGIRPPRTNSLLL